MAHFIVDPGAVHSPPQVMEAGFFLFSAAAKLAKGVAKVGVGLAKTAVGVAKSELGIAPKQQPAFQPTTPAQWSPGMSAPPGYVVVSAGTKSEHLATATGDAGASSSVAGVEQRRADNTSFLDSALQTVKDTLARATGDIARQTGEQIAQAAASSSVAQAKEKQIKTVVIVGGVALGIVLVTVLALALRPRGGH